MICFSAITMNNRNHAEVKGIKGIQFTAGSDVFNNTCYCPSSGCPLPGVRSPSVCKDNASPLFISFPHFYLADKSYNDSIVGMNPDGAIHEFKMVLENVSIQSGFYRKTFILKCCSMLTKFWLVIIYQI